MKRLLITGASGFIGRHCIKPAILAGYEVHAVHRGGLVDAELTDMAVQWHKADLLVQGSGRKLVETVRPSHVLHLAWDVTHGSYWTSPLNLAWLAAGTELVSAFGAHGGKRFVAAGSCAEYDWTDGHLVENVTADQPATFYGRIKLLHHQMLMASAAQFGFQAATGRVFFAYGPHENPLRLIPYACRQLLADQPAKFGNGDLMRDFVHVRDIAAAFIALLRSDATGVFNIASGENVSIREIVTEITELSGKPELVSFNFFPQGAAENRILTGEPARLKNIGWHPSVGLRRGLEESFNWWADHNNQQIA